MKREKSMKIFLILTLSMLSLLSFSGETFSITEKGVIKIGSYELSLTHWGTDWGQSFQDKSFKATTASDLNSDNISIKGTLSTQDGDFSVVENIKKSGDNEILVDFDISSTEGVSTREIALVLSLPMKDLMGKKVLFNDKDVSFDEVFSVDSWLRNSYDLDSIVIPIEGGELKFSSGNGWKFGALLQDERKFQQSKCTLRLRLHQTKKDGTMLKKAQLSMRMQFTPTETIAIDMRNIVNMGFVDKYDNDGKGGWSDQGASNDMRNFPVDKKTFAGIPFTIIDPASNGGKSALVLRGAARPNFPIQSDIEFTQKKRGKYLYVLHTLSWAPVKTEKTIGEIICEFDAGEYVAKQTKRYNVVSNVDVGNFWYPFVIKNGDIGWQGLNDSAKIGLYVSAFELPDADLKKLTFSSYGDSVWIIVGATLASEKLKLGSTVPYVCNAGADWQPLISSDNNKIERNSALDFSFLLDKPSGKYGYLKSKEGMFYFEKQPDVPVRFYGTNLCFDANFLEDKELNNMLDNIAASGFNIVRLHHFDNLLVDHKEKSTTDLNAKKLARLDALFAGCKDRGLYISLDLFTIRKFAKGEIDDYPNRALEMGEVKALAFINDKVMANIETFGYNLLTHINPHTKLAWKDDPTLVSISVINEDTIFATVNRYDWILKLYKQKFNYWLKSNNLSVTSESNNKLWRDFLIETYSKGFMRMRNFMNKNEVKAQLTDANFWSTISTTLLRPKFDYVDNHFYWGHPIFLENSWRLPAQVDNSSATAQGAGGISGIFASRLLNKPFSVTEWNYVNPNIYNVEGAFLVGSYSALQNWNALCQFTYGSSVARVSNKAFPLDFFDQANDPLRMLAERAGTLFFLRNDVQSSQNVYPYILNSNHFDNPQSKDDFPVLITQLGLIGKVGTLITDSKVTLPPNTKAVITSGDNRPKAIPENIPTVNGDVAQDGLAKLMSIGAIPKYSYNMDKMQYTSDTKELILDRKKATFKVITPRSEGFVLPAKNVGQGSFVSVENISSFGAFLVAAIDDKVLTESNRILFLHLTDTKNTNMTFKADDYNVLTAWGTLPLLIHKGEAKVTIQKNLKDYKLYALNVNGKALYEVPMTFKDNSTNFNMNIFGKDKNIILAYELIKK